MSEVKTPKTDALEFDWTAICRGEAKDNAALVVPADSARQLERDRARLIEALQVIVDLDDSDNPLAWDDLEVFEDARALLSEMDK